jgi:hypothetical protein
MGVLFTKRHTAVVANADRFPSNDFRLAFIAKHNVLLGHPCGIGMA